MIFVFLLIGFIWCDNIEIATQDFDEIHYEGQVIYSSGIKNANSIKLSHLGSSIFYLEEISPRIFVIKDKSVYFHDRNPAKIRIDFENKIYKIVYYVYSFIIYCVKTVIIALSIIYIIFKKRKTFQNFYQF